MNRVEGAVCVVALNHEGYNLKLLHQLGITYLM